MKKVKLAEEKLQLAIASPMKLPLTCSSLCSGLQSSPGAAGFGFAPYRSDSQRIMDHYMGSKHERNKRTAIKKTPSFSAMKNKISSQVYFSKFP